MTDTLLLDLVRLRVQTSGFTPVRLSSAVDVVHVNICDASAGIILATDSSALSWIAVGRALAQGLPLLVISRSEEVAVTGLLDAPSHAVYLKDPVDKFHWDALDKTIDGFLSTVACAPPDTMAVRATVETPTQRNDAEKRLAIDTSCHPFELEALAIIAKGNEASGMSLTALGLAMNRRGMASLTSLALNGLRRKGLVQLGTPRENASTVERSENVATITSAGETYIARCEAVGFVDLGAHVPTTTTTMKRLGVRATVP